MLAAADPALIRSQCGSSGSAPACSSAEPTVARIRRTRTRSVSSTAARFSSPTKRVCARASSAKPGRAQSEHRYSGYFYAVAPQTRPPSAPPTRPLVAVGTETLVSLTRRFPDYGCGFFVGHDMLRGMSFASSPLVKTNSHCSGEIGVTRIIRQSSRNVASED